MDGCIFVSVPEMEAASLVYMQKVMNMPVIGIGSVPTSSTRNTHR